MGNNPSKYKGKDNPVELVTWNDAQQFIERLNNQSGQKYRLPTEAEWEYGARSGGKREKYAGTSQEADLNQYAWYGSSSGWLTHLMLVGQKRPNGLGLYDMSGNVWEWCADRYDAGYYKRSPKDNPKGADSGGERVLRGGSWINGPGRLRAAHRYKSDPADRYSIFNGYWGFRLGLSPQ
jgi:sulfatase modifying factor 1